jgi:hypothetical protein
VYVGLANLPVVLLLLLLLLPQHTLCTCVVVLVLLQWRPQLPAAATHAGLKL